MTQNQNTDYIIAELYNLNLLINNIDEPIWLVDRACIILECNLSFKKWVTNFIGKELHKGDHVLDNGLNKIYSEKFEMCYNLALSGRAFSSVEDVLVNNQQRYTTVAFNPVFDKFNNVIGVTCSARDITEHRKHLYRIEEQNTALREIAFIESHRLRAPLANILGLEQFFNYDYLSDPMNGDLMRSISKLSLDLDKIIREVVAKSNEIGLQP